MSQQKQQIKLFPAEEKYFKKTILSLKSKIPNGKLDLQLLQKVVSKKGMVEKNLAQFIVSQSIKLSGCDKMDVSDEGMNILLRYLGQQQNGVDITAINIYTIQTPYLPKFPKSSTQEKNDRDKDINNSVIQVEKPEQSPEQTKSPQAVSKQQPQNNQQVQGQSFGSARLNNVDISMSVHEPRAFTTPKSQNKLEYPDLSKKTGQQQEQQQQQQQYEEEKNKKQHQQLNEKDLAEEKLLEKLQQKNQTMIDVQMLKSINNLNQTLLPMQQQALGDKKFQKIQIKGFDTRKEGLLSKSYVIFFIETSQSSSRVERRFRQFEELDGYFLQSKKYQGRIIPKLPPKEYSLSSFITGASNQETEFLRQRTNDLEDYLNRVNQISYLSDDPVFVSFLEDQNRFTVPQEYQKSLLHSVGEMYEAIRSQNFQDNSDYVQAYFSSKYLEFQNKKMVEMDEIDDIMRDINKYEMEIVQLQEIFYKQYQLEDQKAQKIQSLSKSEDINQSISALESKLLIQSTQHAQIAKLKKSVWKDFRSLACSIDSAKQAHDQLAQQIRNAHFLNHLRERKRANQTSYVSSGKIEEIEREIKTSEAEIAKSKTLLKDELSKFLVNLKKKIKEALTSFTNQTRLEFQQINEDN